MIKKYKFLGDVDGNAYEEEDSDGEYYKVEDVEFVIKDNQTLYKILNAHFDFTNEVIKITNIQNIQLLNAANNFREFLNQFKDEDKNNE
jgi:hypothetical protein